MRAAQRVLPLLRGVRPYGKNRWRALCPAHQDKRPSLSIRQTHDRVLLHCHASCELPDILKALGMRSAAELFDSVDTKPDAELKRRTRARQDLERWAAGYLRIVSKLLREVDAAIQFATVPLSQYENGTLQRNPIMQEKYWALLGKAYKLRTDYEYQFEILNGKDLQAKLDFWREISR